MKLVNDPKIYMIVKTWAGGRRENIEAHFKEANARANAGRYIGDGGFIHIETCKMIGNFTSDICEENGI